jgi:hypothetical protein
VERSDAHHGRRSEGSAVMSFTFAQPIYTLYQKNVVKLKT